MSENVRWPSTAPRAPKDRNASLPEQLDDCRQMAAENGWTIVGEFGDEKFSAYSGNRAPGLGPVIGSASPGAR
jgi:hypothetical protein